MSNNENDDWRPATNMPTMIPTIPTDTADELRSFDPQDFSSLFTDHLDDFASQPNFEMGAATDEAGLDSYLLTSPLDADWSGFPEMDNGNWSSFLESYVSAIAAPPITCILSTC